MFFSMVGENSILLANKNQNTVNSQFKKDLNLQIHLGTQGIFFSEKTVFRFST